MLPATLQFLITMIACAINERMQRKLDYTQEEVGFSRRSSRRSLAAVGSRSPRISVVGCLSLAPPGMGAARRS